MEHGKGIQELMAAEEQAAATVKAARDNHAGEMAKARAAAKAKAQELRERYEKEYNAQVDSKEDSLELFQQQLDSQVAKEKQEIDVQYEKNCAAAIDLLLYTTTSVKLEVSEAMKQSMID